MKKGGNLRSPIEHDTVDLSEKAYERSSEAKAPKPQKLPDMRPVTIQKVENFTCPGCQETLSEVVSVNSKVQGWCGRSHSYINQKV